MTLVEFRSVLRGLSSASMAALLVEIGFDLYRREIARWRVLTDLADDLMDKETFLAKRHLDDDWIRKARRKVTRHRRLHR